MHFVLRRIVLLVTLMTAVAASTQAVDWADYATVSMTDPLTPKLSANKLCYSDGRDLLCDGAAGLIVTSGTVQVPGLIAGGITVTGNTSATYISTTAIQITSQTTATTCSSGNAGTLRYNSPTTTLELCTGSGWQPMGVGIPAGTISAFASTTCPTGWSEYTAARGRFLRGIDNGANLDPNGTRTPGGTQADAMQGHYHNIYTNGSLLQYNVNFSNGSGGVAPTYNTGSAAATQATAPIADGTNGTPRTSSETRPVNVAVTFCHFNGTSNGWNNPLSGGGGGATPAGSGADVQYNSGGALAADTGLFTYASGVLKAPTVSATNLYASSVSGTTGTFSSIGAGNIAASGNISLTGVIKVGTTATTCATGISGTMRYSTTSSTMEYCNGSAWTSMGPSTTQPIAFSVNKNGTGQTVAANTWTKLTWSNEAFDTNNNFSGSTFTPSVPGKYLLTLNVYCNDSNFFCSASLYKNGANVAQANGYYTASSFGTVTHILDMNGTTDYVDAYVQNAGGTAVSGVAALTYFTGVLLAPQGGGSGGTATPAGSTADIQFNSAGALAADTGNLTYASSVLKAPTISATNLNGGSVSATTATFSGSIQYGGTGSESCSSAADYGKSRKNPTSGRIQVCLAH